MTTFNHIPYPLGMSATAANFNAALEQLDEAIGLHNRIATTDPGASNDSSQGYAAGRSIWLNTVSDTVFICITDAVGAATWQDVASGQTIDMDDVTQGTLALANGGTNTNLGSTGPGWWRQNSSGAGVSVRELQASDMPSLTSRLSVGGADAFAGANLLDAVARQQIKLNGTTIGTRRGINLIPVVGATATVSLAVTDSAPDEHVNVEISVSGGGVGTDELVRVGIGGTPDFLSSNFFYRDPTNNIQVAQDLRYARLLTTFDNTQITPFPDEGQPFGITITGIPASVWSTYKELVVEGLIRPLDIGFGTGTCSMLFRVNNDSNPRYRRNLTYNNGTALSVLADSSSQSSFVIGQLQETDSWEAGLRIRIAPMGYDAGLMIWSELVRNPPLNASPTYWTGSCRYSLFTNPSILTLSGSINEWLFITRLRVYGIF